MQRGWFARDTAGAGWTTDAREGTHGCRCVAAGVVGDTQCCGNGLLFGSFVVLMTWKGLPAVRKEPFALGGAGSG
ncbi:hypothetical protein NC652_028847 [Populus alba x Populus x berolinensis]|nr:hypothetical protein NC652_028847 [Populus alba x Populus x berolinensis]